jgi:hypothetical protein
MVLPNLFLNQRCLIFIILVHLLCQSYGDGGEADHAKTISTVYCQGMNQKEQGRLKLDEFLFNDPDIPTKLSHRDVIHKAMRNTSPIVIEEFRTVFFQVAKVASSQWTRFMMRLEGNPCWCSEDTDLHDHAINGLTYLSDYPVEVAEKIMNDPEWTRAIFVRHPKPRLLSAFLDKSIIHTDHFGNFTCPQYERHGGNLDDCIERHQDFAFFLMNVTRTLPKNVHWRSIYSRIDEKWWPSINYIGYMENLSEDTENYLRKIYSMKDNVTAWERMGSTGWGDNERDCNGGNSSFLEEKVNHHQTNARSNMLKYYTRDLEHFVDSHYADDLNNQYFHFIPDIQLYSDEEEDFS